MFVEVSLRLVNGNELEFFGLSDDVKMDIKSSVDMREVESGVIWVEGKIKWIGYKCVGYWSSVSGKYIRNKNNEYKLIWDEWK